MPTRNTILLMTTFLPLILALRISAGENAAPDFNSEVRPILANNCFKCHGPDDKARKGAMRLDQREGAVSAAKSGEFPIVPRNLEKSELIKRIFSKDDEEVMPPRNTKKVLTDAQKDILKRWVATGAEYRPHWAFVPPIQAELPKVKQEGWARNPIDRFILARLESEGLQPSPQADRYTLARRVYLDLIGLPPTPEEADAFAADQSPGAYEKLVDRLLAMPQYGERWARKWLDLARYADTNGYEKDRPRTMWPWRDWVINSLNADMPFDQFTIQQIAGDMLPNATTENIIATGFHRNTMLNEEGGIDPLEFRYYSMTDRVATTGKTWLGLTTGCAQCHTHKFDPITHREYFQMMAFLNNADEPEYKIKPPDFETRKAEVDAKIAKAIADLPNKFPATSQVKWTIPEGVTVATKSGEKAEPAAENAWKLSGKSAETDTYTVEFDIKSGDFHSIRLEALPDNANPHGGPGRAESGNFVMNEFVVLAAPAGDKEKTKTIKLVHPEADFSQPDYNVAGAIDGNAKTGWAIDNVGHDINVVRTATFDFEKPLHYPDGAHFTIRMEQNFGLQHTLGHFRISLGTKEEAATTDAGRRENIDKRFNAWIENEAKSNVSWSILRPVEAKANMPILSVLDDASVFASGDQTKSDTYDLRFKSELQNITAIRLEVIPDERLPKNGPGRVFYEGAPGDFSLSEFTASAGENAPLKISKAIHSFANSKFPVSNSIDGKADTIWSIDGGQGKYHTAVFILEKPLAVAADFRIQMLFERHFSAGLGRFRISVTTDSPPAAANELPGEIGSLLRLSADKRTPAQRDQLFQAFLMATPELAGARKEIDNLRNSLNGGTTTLVMAERAPEHPRPTYMHNRGEYMQPGDRVEPGVLKVLNPLPKDAPANRLGFARWLVAPENPLTARVTVNRQWSAFFGRGIVRTVDDFGYQGEPPVHPALLDWLAVEFVKQGWSLKKIHKLIVMSATYQQSSRTTPELQAKDPGNLLLARGPRFRLEAEGIRDALLRESGLLTDKIGGPSVYPPQPSSVTTEGTYGSLAWNISNGPDRFRRGLYTFSKRTSPYAMFSTFDGPSGEACIAQREISNSPLQALTMLNDTVILEAAQALGRTMAAQKGEPSIEKRVEFLFRRCLTRPPQAEETRMLTQFFNDQKQRFEKKELDPAPLAGKGEGDINERAAWTALARVLLNIDEAITKG